MFGFSISELLLIVAVAAVVWVVWKRTRRIGAQARRSAARREAAGPATSVEDTIKCPVCGLYVPAQAPAPCDRADCPYRG